MIDVRIVSTLDEVSPAEWDALADRQPLLSHAFLHALHESGCASARTGWRPVYVTAWDKGSLAGAVPLYAKTHSWGEYVFDWAWADAYRRHGRRYYPKLVTAVPFTPATGPRLLARDASTAERLIEEALAMAPTLGASSLHVLFPDEVEAGRWASAGLMVRHGVQFHWRNPGCRDFADYLDTMTRDKRKKIRQERRRVADAGVTFRRVVGRDIDDRLWRLFDRCYRRTYSEHGSTAYLDLAFFRRIGRTMPESLLLVVGEREGTPVCAALDVFDQRRLYGRYWGALDAVPGMHFEACYYQAIEFCIERRIAVFEGGAQGGHKVARGLLPVRTHSAHWIADRAFASAIADFLEHERAQVGHALDELSEHSPFRDAGQA